MDSVLARYKLSIKKNGRAGPASSMTYMGEEMLVKHLLLENAYDINLVADIPDVDYLAGHLGCIHLSSLQTSTFSWMASTSIDIRRSGMWS